MDKIVERVAARFKRAKGPDPRGRNWEDVLDGLWSWASRDIDFSVDRRRDGRYNLLMTLPALQSKPRVLKRNFDDLHAAFKMGQTWYDILEEWDFGLGTTDPKELESMLRQKGWM